MEEAVATGGPVFLTKNGYGSMAVTNMEQYESLTGNVEAMLDELRAAGNLRASLSVQKESPAARLYEGLGFRIVGDGFDETEWLMVCRFE